MKSHGKTIVCAALLCALAACGPPSPPPGSCRTIATPNIVAGEPFAWEADCALPDGATGPVIVAFPALRDGPRTWIAPDWLGVPTSPGYIAATVRREAHAPEPMTLGEAAGAVRVDPPAEGWRAGERVKFSIGKGENGAPIASAPTVAAKGYAPVVLIEVAAGFTAMDGVAPLDIAAGPASRIELVAPSSIETKKPFEAIVRITDRHGNSAAPPRETRVFFKEREDVGIDLSYNAPKSAMLAGAVTHVAAGSFDLAGFRWIVADTRGAFDVAMSNPIAVSAPGEGRPIAFGDLDLPESADIGGAFDTLGLGFAAIADPAHVVDATLAEKRGDACAASEILGRFMPLVARNHDGAGRALALFDRCAMKPSIEAGVEPSPWWRAALASRPPLATNPTSGHYGAAAWSDALRDTGGLIAAISGDDQPLDAVAPQAGRVRAIAVTPAVANANADNPQMPGIEAGALGAAGRRFGFIGARGALTAMLPGALTRRTVYDNVASGRTYVTGGARILLYADVDGKPPGREYTPGGPPAFHLEAAGAAPLQSVELYQDGKAVFAHPFDAPTWVANEDVTIRDLTRGGTFVWRVTQTDGQSAWSSPFFLRHPNWSSISGAQAESMGDAIEIRFDFAPGLNTIDIELRRRAGDDGGGDPNLFERISGRWPPGPVVVRDKPANAYGEAVHYVVLERNAEASVVIARMTAPPAFPAHTEPEGSWRLGGRVNETGAARVVVSDASGRAVRTMDLGEREAGVVETVWDGRDDAGRRALGPMFYRLDVGERMGPRMPIVDLGMAPTGPDPGEPEPAPEPTP